MELVRSHPGNGIVLIGSGVDRIPPPAVDHPDVHPEVGTVYVGEGDTNNVRGDAQLLLQLAGQGDTRVLTLVHVATRQVPGIGVPPPLR